MRARFPSENIFNASELRIAFGMLIFSSVKRGVNDNFSDLFKDVLEMEILGDYNLLSIQRFEIATNDFLDICLFNFYTLHKNSLLQTGAKIKSRYRREWQLKCSAKY